MLIQQPLILALALAAAFFVPGTNGQALAESMSMTLPFALTVGKALFTAPKPFIEVSSTQGIYISEGHAFALADTQCMHTETPPVQLCFGNRWPTRIGLLPHGHLKMGLHTLGLSQFAYTHHPSFVTESLVPGQDRLPELSPWARAIVTQILQGVKAQSDILEQARQRSLMLSLLNHYKSHYQGGHIPFEEPLGEGDAEEDSDPIVWWEVAQPPASHTNDSDLVRVRFENVDNNILLKPGTRYCFAPDARTKTDRQAPPDESSGGEDSGTSDENNDNDSDEEETDTEPDIVFIGTTPNPFPVSREVHEYCASLEQRKIKQEPISDSEMPTEPEIDNTQYSHLGQDSGIPIRPETRMAAADSTHKLPATSKKDSKKDTHSGERHYPCQECGKRFAQKGTLKRHLRTHSGEKPYRCELCGKAFARGSTLRTHRLTHSGAKPYRCTLCGKTFTQGGTLRTHQLIHSGEKPHPCQVCGKAFARGNTLKTHLYTHSGEKPYRCQQCSKTFAQSSSLKVHLRTHSGEKPYRCQECGKAFAQNCHLKKHQRAHRTAEQPPTQRK